MYNKYWKIWSDVAFIKKWFCLINSIKQMHKVILNKLFLMFVVVQNLFKNLNVKKLAIVLTVDQNLNKL